MSSSVEQLGTYLHLARASGVRQRPHIRDRFLVLAAVLAARLELPRIAAHCRHLVLQHNPQHLVGRWPTIELALDSADFHHFLRHLERRFPPEQAEQMLGTLGIELAREREAYYTDEEYAAALLRIRPNELPN
jgi:hypothetical protein